MIEARDGLRLLREAVEKVLPGPRIELARDEERLERDRAAEREVLPLIHDPIAATGHGALDCEAVLQGDADQSEGVLYDGRHRSGIELQGRAEGQCAGQTQGPARLA